MSKGEYFSDEILNAFIDGELDEMERATILTCLENESILKERVNELRYVKELVHAARPKNIKTHGPLIQKNSKYLYIWSTAAAIMLTLLIALNLFTHSTQTDSFVTADKQIQQIVTSHVDKKQIKVVIHVTKDDPMTVKTLLDKAELLVKLENELNKPVRVEIVANGKGLSLFQTDLSTYSSRIVKLRREYDNLLFVACQETMQHLTEKKNKKVKLLPGVVSVMSGNDEVALRRSQGWSYLTI